MGYRDDKLKLSAAQTVTAEASDNWIDTELTSPGWERGSTLAVVLNVETTATGSTGYNFTIVHKASGQPGTGDTDLVTFRIPVANLTKGKEFVLPLPIGVPILRYVGVYYTRINGDESMVCSAYFTPMQIADTTF